MRKFALVIFLFFLILVCGQPSSAQKGWAVTLTGTLIPIGQPGLGIQTGAEYRFNKRWSLLSELVFRANKTNSKDSSTLDKHYGKVKSELRYIIFSKKDKLSHGYAGLQLSWASRKFINTEGYYYNNRHDDSVSYYSRAAINSPVTTFSAQIGSIITDGRFAVDVFIGVGARFIHTTISDVKNPVRSVKPTGGSGLHFTASYSYAGNITMFHLNGGLRFMWHFYNFKHPRKP